jgi:intracellular sulfur oxidation DsrE/DsrF family protein
MSRVLTLVAALLMPLSLLAQAPAPVDQLLESGTPPPGVVFDVDEWDHDALQWAVPLIREQVARLRARFPDLPVAVVSHGEEEFALMASARDAYPGVHRQVKRLAGDRVSVHVCAGHAVMNGYNENNFVEFVDPVAAGVEAIAEYRRRGYVYILIDRPR